MATTFWYEFSVDH